MRFAVGFVVNAWVFGVPIVLMAWAALRLLHRAPARMRYALTIVAFLAVIAMPLIPREHGAAAAVVDKAADAITFPVVLLWTIGAAILLAREAIGHLRLRGAREDAPAELCRLLEWSHRVPLAVSDDTPPLTVGLLAPRVVLPRDIATAFPLDVARRIARHELSHCRWRDPLVYALMRIAASLFWLWPVWPLLRWARREREVAADEFALRASGGEEEHYVAALLRLAHVHQPAASAMAANDLEFRARRILGATRRSSFAVSLLVFLAAAVFAAGAEPVSVEPGEAEDVRVHVIVDVQEIK